MSDDCARGAVLARLGKLAPEQCWLGLHGSAAERLRRSGLAVWAGVAFGAAVACQDEAVIREAAGPAEGAAGGTAASGALPAVRGRVDLDERTLATRALGLMGGTTEGAGACSGCHSMGRPTLTRWRQLTEAFVLDCLQGSMSSPAEIDLAYACVTERGRSARGNSPSDYGIYAAAAHLGWFDALFARTTASVGEQDYEDFVRRVGMPRAGRAWTQAEFDVVAEWFARGLPRLLELVPEDSGVECRAGLDAALEAQVSESLRSGWRARNEQVPLLMFGCGEGQEGVECLTGQPSAADDAASEDWQAAPGTTLRLLYDNSDSPSAYWSRSSADGRFLAFGLNSVDVRGNGGKIIDLQEQRAISGDFSFDAMFFPDNSGLLVQRDENGESGGYSVGPTDGAPRAGDVALVCEQSVLSRVDELTGDERECSRFEGEIGLYQQVGRSLVGDDAWVVFGSYESDNGGFEPTYRNPGAAFERTSTTAFVTFTNQGNGFSSSEPILVETPWQGDPVLSPSSAMLVLRTKGRESTQVVDGQVLSSAEQGGYALYRVDTETTVGTAGVSLQPLGQLCVTGGKPAVSYDDRWLVLHHYVTEDDAADLGESGVDDDTFQRYRDLGSSNLYLVDLLTGESRRITLMPPGHYALFPHFRSDGWIYFVVRTLEGEEYFVASDAALVAE